MRSLVRLAMAAWFVCACAGVGSAGSFDAMCAPYRVALEDMTRADQLLVAIQANDTAAIDSLGETVAQDGRRLQTLSPSGGASDALSSVGARLTTAALQAQDGRSSEAIQALEAARSAMALAKSQLSSCA